MMHARADYDRIQDPKNLIPRDEPVFLLRGQDKHAAKVVRFYADLVGADDGDAKTIELARLHADRMDEWPTKKSPDI